MTAPVFDDAYCLKLTVALLDAIIATSRVEVQGEPVTIVRNHELTLALISILADALMTSEGVKERQAVEFVEKRLRAAIREVRKAGTPFENAVRRPAVVN